MRVVPYTLSSPPGIHLLQVQAVEGGEVEERKAGRRGGQGGRRAGRSGCCCPPLQGGQAHCLGLAHCPSLLLLLHCSDLAEENIPNISWFVRAIFFSLKFELGFFFTSMSPNGQKAISGPKSKKKTYLSKNKYFFIVYLDTNFTPVSGNKQMGRHYWSRECLHI